MATSRYAPLVSLASTKRSRVVAALIFTTFVIFFISRLNEPGARLFGRPPPAEQAPIEYNGPRFELFGIRDFAADVEVATLNVRVKDEEDSEPAALAHPHRPTSSQQDSEERRGDSNSNSHSNTLSSVQRQLPITLPKFTRHDLASPSFNASDLDAPTPGVPPATISLVFPPRPPQPDASRLVFGVATTLDRMPDSLRNFAHWAAHTNTRFIVLHEPRNTTLRPGEPTADEVRRMYSDAGIARLTLIERDAGWGQRFVALLGQLAHRLEVRTEWGVLIDDDTFFFDLAAVQGMLAKYDPALPWYVGALSDNKWNVNNGGLFGVGGAGLFLSRTLLETMAPYADGCYPEDEGTMAGGDVLVGECIHRHTTTKLTAEHGLYQLDMHGDVTGFYEAVRPQPLSVHHWKSWHHHDIPSVAAVSKICGRPCILQNFRFQDGWQMSNGFSLVKYGYNETELKSQHPLAMEHTWKVTIWDIEDSWKYSMAPLKEKDDKKVQFLMERVEEADAGKVTLYYVRRDMGVARAVVKVVWHRIDVSDSFGTRIGGSS